MKKNAKDALQHCAFSLCHGPVAVAPESGRLRQAVSVSGTQGAFEKAPRSISAETFPRSILCFPAQGTAHLTQAVSRDLRAGRRRSKLAHPSEAGQQSCRPPSGVGPGPQEVGADPSSRFAPGDVVWCPPGVKHWHGRNAYHGDGRNIAVTGTVAGQER